MWKYFPLPWVNWIQINWQSIPKNLKNVNGEISTFLTIVDACKYFSRNSSHVFKSVRSWFWFSKYFKSYLDIAKKINRDYRHFYPGNVRYFYIFSHKHLMISLFHQKNHQNKMVHTHREQKMKVLDFFTFYQSQPTPKPSLTTRAFLSQSNTGCLKTNVIWRFPFVSEHPVQDSR